MDSSGLRSAIRHSLPELIDLGLHRICTTRHGAGQRGGGLPAIVFTVT